MGLKSLHDLYPLKINEKIIADSKIKTWDEKHKLAVAEQSRRIAEFDTANASSMYNLIRFDNQKKKKQRTIKNAYVFQTQIYQLAINW